MLRNLMGYEFGLSGIKFFEKLFFFLKYKILIMYMYLIKFVCILKIFF